MLFWPVLPGGRAAPLPVGLLWPPEGRATLLPLGPPP